MTSVRLVARVEGLGAWYIAAMAATFDLASNPFERFIATLIDSITRRDRPTAPTDGIERTIRDVAAPFARAADDAAFDRALASLKGAMPALLRELPRFTADEFESQSTGALRKLPWLLQHVAGDVEPAALASEFGALAQFSLRYLSRFVARAPTHVVERAVERRDEDLVVAAGDPVGGRLFDGFLVLIVLVGLHEALGPSDHWRRRRLLVHGRGVLREVLDLIPVERSFATNRWLVRTARELGLWFRTADLMRRIETLLSEEPLNRAALQALAERWREGTSLIYVRDVDATFVECVGGEHVIAAHDAWLAAGEAYERAEISIDELARRWAVDVPDAVASLEADRFVRPAAALRLGEEERLARLARLRADRMSRRGMVVHDPEVVRRSVIASQRIEGIDARAYLPRAPRDPT